VFYGRVRGTTFVVRGREVHLDRVTFDVFRAFKGLTSRTFTGDFDSYWSESHKFRTGQVVVVYARRSGDVWGTECSFTHGYEPNEDNQTDARQLESELAELARCSPTAEVPRKR
jgi:hypothetical protein